MHDAANVSSCQTQPLSPSQRHRLRCSSHPPIHRCSPCPASRSTSSGSGVVSGGWTSANVSHYRHSLVFLATSVLLNIPPPGPFPPSPLGTTLLHQRQRRKRHTLTSSPAIAYQANISQLPNTMAALCRRCRSSHISLLRAPRASSPVRRASPPTLLPCPTPPPLLPLVVVEAALPPLVPEADDALPRGAKPEKDAPPRPLLECEE